MPVRKIPRNYCHNTGVISSKKSIGEAEYEAGLEPEFYKILAFDPRVASFEVQPVRIDWHDSSGKKRQYTTDCRVHFILCDGASIHWPPIPPRLLGYIFRSRGLEPNVAPSRARDAEPPKVLFEVKFRSTLKKHWKELRPVYRAAVHHARREGSRFRLVTDKEIRTPYLENVKFLLPIVRRGAPPVELQNKVLAAIRKVNETTPRLLLSGFCESDADWGLMLPVLWYLIGTFQVHADLTTPLEMDSLISSNE